MHEQAKALPVMTASSKALQLCSAATMRCIWSALQCIYWGAAAQVTSKAWPLRHPCLQLHPSWVGDGNHQLCTSSCPDELPFPIFNFKTDFPLFLRRLDLVGHVVPSWQPVKVGRWQNSHGENCTHCTDCALHFSGVQSSVSEKVEGTTIKTCPCMHPLLFWHWLTFPTL